MFIQKLLFFNINPVELTMKILHYVIKFVYPELLKMLFDRMCNQLHSILYYYL